MSDALERLKDLRDDLFGICAEFDSVTGQICDAADADLTPADQAEQQVLEEIGEMLEDLKDNLRVADSAVSRAWRKTVPPLTPEQAEILRRHLGAG